MPKVIIKTGAHRGEPGNTRPTRPMREYHRFPTPLADVSTDELEARLLTVGIEVSQVAATLEELAVRGFATREDVTNHFGKSWYVMLMLRELRTAPISYRSHRRAMIEAIGQTLGLLVLPTFNNLHYTKVNFRESGAAPLATRRVLDLNAQKSGASGEGR